MKTYEYRGFDNKGHACRGLVEALSVKAVREKLAGDGILVDRVSVTGRSLKFPAELRVLVYRELGALLEAGLPLVRSLDILIDSPELRKSHLLLAGVRDRVKEGSSLADAFAEASSSVSPFEKAFIESAEQTASVETMLDRLASFLEEQEELKDTIQSALIYPFIVLVVGICVAILMLGLLLPRASEMLADSGATVPFLTLMMLGLGDFLMGWGWLIVVACVLCVVYIKSKLREDISFRRKWGRAMMGLPVLGKGNRILANLRFARTFSVLLNGGVSSIDALVMSGRATGNAWVSELTEREAEQVRNGSSLSDAVRRIPPLAESLPGWIQVGEASGGLSKRLESAGRKYEGNWNRFVRRSMSCLEPVLMLLIGGFVLLVVLSILLPIFQLTHAVG